MNYVIGPEVQSDPDVYVNTLTVCELPVSSHANWFTCELACSSLPIKLCDFLSATWRRPVRPVDHRCCHRGSTDGLT